MRLKSKTKTKNSDDDNNNKAMIEKRVSETRKEVQKKREKKMELLETW